MVLITVNDLSLKRMSYRDAFRPCSRDSSGDLEGDFSKLDIGVKSM